MKCNYCEEQLEDISFNGIYTIQLSHKEQVGLYVCTSRDCRNGGMVLAIPWTNKDEEDE